MDLKKVVQLAGKDFETAFSSAHTLKGVTLNLAFDKLAKASVVLTDALRPQNRDNYSPEDFDALFLAVEEEYTAVCVALEKTTMD